MRAPGVAGSGDRWLRRQLRQGLGIRTSRLALREQHQPARTRYESAAQMSVAVPFHVKFVVIPVLRL
jgi:hypothetical protein